MSTTACANDREMFVTVVTLHDVSGPDLVFEQQEETSEVILDQALRAKTKRQADHAGCTKNRGQHQHHRDGADHHGK
jgi:hypothetical protein